MRLGFHGTHRLTHVHYDVFEVTHDPSDDFDRMRLVFATDAAGDVASFAMRLEAATKPIVFVRGPNRAMMNERFLAPFVKRDGLVGRSIGGFPRFRIDCDTQVRQYIGIEGPS